MLAMLLSSCSLLSTVSRMEAVGTTHVERAMINAIPSTATGASAIVCNDTEFVVVERTGEDFDSLMIARVRFPSTRVWRTKLATPESIAHLDFEPNYDERLGYISQMTELIHHFFFRDGKIILVSSRTDDDEGIHVLVRHFDASTGKELLNRVVASLPADRKESDRDRRFVSTIAPDSLSFSVTNVGIDQSNSDLRVQTVMIANLDGSIAQTRTHESVIDDHTTPRVLLANNGELYFVSIYDTKELRVVHVDAKGESVETVFPLKTPSDAREIELRNEIEGVEADGSITVAMAGWSSSDLAAVQIVRYDPARGPAYLPVYSITEELTNALVDEDEIDEGTVVALRRTDVAAARFVIVVEGREIEEQRDKYGGGSTNYGSTELLLLAFDDNGRPTWQKGIDKSSWIKFGAGWENNSPVLRVAGTTMDLLYREEDGVSIRRYDLATGNELLRNGPMQLMLFDNNGGQFTNSTLWTGPTSFYATIDGDDGAEMIKVDYTLP